MTINSFEPGHIDYAVKHFPGVGEMLQALSQIPDEAEGYLAFSNKEVPYDPQCDLPELFQNSREQNAQSAIEGVEGYLMELNIWWTDGDTCRELSVERMDDGFLLQDWNLHKKEGEGKRCYFRLVNTSARDNSIFRESPLKSYEVIWPEYRLHFFITAKE